MHSRLTPFLARIFLISVWAGFTHAEPLALPVEAAKSKPCPASTDEWKSFMVTIRDNTVARLKAASDRGETGFNYKAAVDFEVAARCFKEKERRDATMMTPYLAECVGPTVKLLGALKEEGTLTWHTNPAAMEWPMSDADYIDKIDAITKIPSDLEAQKFLDLLDREEVPALVDYKKSDGWKKILGEKSIFEAVEILEIKKKEFKKQALYRYFDGLNATRAEKNCRPF